MWDTFGIEPESFDYATMEMEYPAYPLRPEAIESAYYLFMLTGDERWREMGKDMFRRVVAAARTDEGFAHLQDVRTGEKTDAMQSFFLAETLKYAYLLAAPSALDFDAVVFNTEAHPLWPPPGPRLSPPQDRATP
jgi:mannosidase alpha-like ER degradation enhancer 2